MKKTWAEKLADKPNLPKVLRLEKRFPCYNAVHRMGAEAGDEVILANPSEVVEIMAGLDISNMRYGHDRTSGS